MAKTQLLALHNGPISGNCQEQTPNFTAFGHIRPAINPKARRAQPVIRHCHHES